MRWENLLGRTFQKYGHFGGDGTKNFGRKGGGGWGVTLKRGVHVEMGGCHFLLLYSSIAFAVCGGKVKFLLLHFGSSVFCVNDARFSFKSS